MKKIFLALTLSILLALMAFLPAYATEGTQDPAQDATQTITPETPTEEQPPAQEPSDVTEKPVTQLATDWIVDNLGGILSALSLLVLSVLSWLIKKRLIPAVASAIDAAAKRSEAASGSFNAGTARTVELLELAGGYLDGCSKRVEKMIAEWEKRSAAQGKAYELQTDLINYLLMNLRIPNELKAEVAQRAEAVKEALKEAREG